MDIKIYQRGNILRISPAVPAVRGPLMKLLRYMRLKYEHQPRWKDGKPSRKSHAPLQFLEVECFQLRTFDGVQQLVTNTGYLSKITALLQQHGHVVHHQDQLPHPRPEVFLPRWEILKDFDLRYKQKETFQALAAHARARVWQATGAGKSFMIAVLCRLFPKTQIVVTTRFQDPLEQLSRDIGAIVPSTGIYCSRKKRMDRRVMCVSAGSLHHVDFGKVDILIGDELHELCSDQLFSVFARFRTSRMYGFSANMDDRFDKADFELEGLFGPIVSTLTYEEGVKHGMIVPIEVHLRSIKLDRNPALDKVGTSWFRHAIWRNVARNKQIAADANSFPDEQLLIAVATFEHAAYLKKYLPHYTLVYAPGDLRDEDVDAYVGQGILKPGEPIMTMARRQQLKKQFETGKLKHVIATTVWNRGVNFRRLGVLIRADGSRSAIGSTQIPGRLSRTMPDGSKVNGICIDYLDEFDEKAARNAEERIKHYRKLKWQVISPEESQQRRLF